MPCNWMPQGSSIGPSQSGVAPPAAWIAERMVARVVDRVDGVRSVDHDADTHLGPVSEVEVDGRISRIEVEQFFHDLVEMLSEEVPVDLVCLVARDRQRAFDSDGELHWLLPSVGSTSIGGSRRRLKRTGERMPIPGHPQPEPHPTANGSGPLNAPTVMVNNRPAGCNGSCWRSSWGPRASCGATTCASRSRTVGVCSPSGSAVGPPSRTPLLVRPHCR